MLVRDRIRLPQRTSQNDPARPRLLRLESLEDRLLLSARAVSAVNQFGLDAYEHLQNEQGNLFFSPLSIATGLTMAYEGAAGQTAAEMEQVLHLGSAPGIGASFQELLETLGSQEVFVPPTGPWLPPFHPDWDPNWNPGGFQSQLNIANAMWPQIGLPLEGSFVDTITTSYDGYAQNLDYSNTRQAEDTINNWVSQQTQGKIEDLVSNLSSNTAMVLTNAIHFTGLWESPFDPQYTYSGQFTLADGQTVSTPTMYTEVGAFLTELDGFQILDLPFEEESASMVFVLPPAGNPTAQLTNEVIVGIDDWFAGSRDNGFCEVSINLPKFQTTVETNLESLLQGLGMPTAFTYGAADFSEMTSTAVAIEKVFHKATIKVNEQGTEAAAATEIEFGLCFAAGTPVLTPDGEKPIEQLKPGEQVLARDEHKLEAATEPKVVEKTFQGSAEIVELHVGGQVLRPTGPHRFFVNGKGWTPANELKVHDMLSTNYRDWAKVEKVTRTGEEVPVYNFRVADHHTYFVGSESWGFAIWTHNSYGGEEFNANRPFHMIIRDNATSAITFMGRIDDPTQLQNSLNPTVVDTNADFNSDQVVDGFDFLALQRGYGISSGAALTDGDSNADGAVDATDMSSWDTHYGQTAQQVAAATAGEGQEETSQRAASVSSASLLDAALATQWLGAINQRADEFVAPDSIVEAVFASVAQSVATSLAPSEGEENSSERSSSEDADSQPAGWLSDELLESLFAGPQNSPV